jgi:16S rRNA (uracil1498-N3)-methyltransferase
MRKVRAPIAGLASGEQTLDAAAAHYVSRVLRLSAGDGFVAFDPARAVEAEAVLVRVTDRAVVARIGEVRPGGVAARAPLTWIQGMAKGEKVDAIVRDATELGATRIVAAATARSVVKLAESKKDDRRARWERIAREAARQCGRSDAPEVAGPLPWDASLATVEPDAARFFLWESATQPLAPELAGALAGGGPIAFAVGPEGGFSEEEAALAQARGWKALSIGPFILRTETVAAAVLGAVRVWTG